MPTTAYPADAFGDPFELAALPLPRAAVGYAVQLLDTDQLLDRQTGEFLPVRSQTLHACHDSFANAYASAFAWTQKHAIAADEHRLAIVPLGYDPLIGRHVLIYGVLCGQP